MIAVGKVRRTAFWLGLVLPVFALVTTIWVAHVAEGQVNGAFASVTHTYRTLNLLEEIQAHVADAETGQRGYLLTSRDDYFALYDTAMSAANSDIQQLKGLVQDNPAQEQNVAVLQSLIAKRLGPNPVGAAFKKNPLSENAVALTDQGRDTMNQFRSLLYGMREAETDLLASRQQRAEQRFILDQTLSLALVAVTAIALIAIVAIVLRLEHLRQIVTICAWTGQVKHDGDWIPMEKYLKERFGLSVSHGLSREAAEKMTRDIPRRTPKID